MPLTSNVLIVTNNYAAETVEEKHQMLAKPFWFFNLHLLMISHQVLLFYQHMTKTIIFCSYKQETSFHHQFHGLRTAIPLVTQRHILLYCVLRML